MLLKDCFLIDCSFLLFAVKHRECHGKLIHQAMSNVYNFYLKAFICSHYACFYDIFVVATMLQMVAHCCFLINLL